jgi:hypothetical protein
VEASLDDHAGLVAAVAQADVGLGHVRGALPQPQPTAAAQARPGYQGSWQR